MISAQGLDPVVEVWRQTPPGRIKKGGPGMEIKNPIVINMVQMLGEICERDPEQHVIRALYMITKEVHELITNPRK
jgi:hypothetical protein